MKKIAHVLTALALCVSLTSCLTPPTPTAGQRFSPTPVPYPSGTAASANTDVKHDFYTMSDRQGDIAALLFMGAGDEFSAAESYVKEKYFSALKDKWPENVETAEAAAWEIYLILPKYKGTTVTVHELDSDGNAVAELVSTENPVLLKCNVSDITPSAKATIRFKGVETVFIPFISLEDGSVSGGDNVYAEDCAKAAKGVG